MYSPGDLVIVKDCDSVKAQYRGKIFKVASCTATTVTIVDEHGLRIPGSIDLVEPAFNA